MVAPAEGEEAGPVALALGNPVLEGHFDSDLDGHGAGIGEEDPFESIRRKPGQSFAEFHRGLMGEASEHDMRHLFKLGSDGTLNMGMAVAVDGRPPGRHAVDQFSAVAELEMHALSALHGEKRGSFGTRVGVPDMPLVSLDQVVGGLLHAENLASPLRPGLFPPALSRLSSGGRGSSWPRPGRRPGSG